MTSLLQVEYSDKTNFFLNSDITASNLFALNANVVMSIFHSIIIAHKSLKQEGIYTHLVIQSCPIATYIDGLLHLHF